jgi:hypothetical protein
MTGLGLGGAPARASPAPPVEHSVSAAPKPQHDSPRLKLSFRQLWIANLDGSQLPMHGGQLDVYPLSRRWVRLGLELEGGAGSATVDTHGVDLWYGLAGLSLGVQYPARVTPFVEGRFAAGILGGSLAQAVQVSPGLSLGSASTATYLLTGGIDVGIEVYIAGRFYVSAAIGWVHPVYRGVDYGALTSATPALVYKDIATDSFTFKLGVGI